MYITGKLAFLVLFSAFY